jgi:hypothetical protein
MKDTMKNESLFIECGSSLAKLFLMERPARKQGEFPRHESKRIFYGPHR